jgi:hypothetical protein
MRQTLSTRSPRPATGPDPTPGSTLAHRVGSRVAAASALLLAMLAILGCTQPIRSAEDLARQVQEIGCISRCQETKDRCDSDARFDYAECQAGYSSSTRDYRRCLASGDGQCGYPWWSCSENRYGYCTNRYWECHSACRRIGG